MNSTVILVDATNLLFRGHFSHKGLATTSGISTSAIYSFLSLTKNLYSKFPASDLVFCWDPHSRQFGNTASSVRKKLYPPYKSNRTQSDDIRQAQSQIEPIKEMLGILGHLQVEIPGMEADDLLSIGARHLHSDASIEKIYIHSGDRDLYQCVNDKIHCLYPGKKGLVVVDQAAVKKEFGIGPKMVPLLKALTGDSVDHYPGVKNCGPKKGLALLAKGIRPDLPTFEEHPKDVQIEFQSLKSVWDEIHLFYRLAKTPISIKSPLIPDESKAPAFSFLIHLQNHRGRVYTRSQFEHAAKKFTDFCIRYQLASFVASRSKFFAGIEIIV